MNLDNERVKYIHSRLSKNLGRENSVKELDSTTLPTKSDSHFGSRNYFVVVGLGKPKRDLSLIFDTGSDLTWTQCEPCAGSCYKQQDAIFDPSMSRSFLVGFVEGLVLAVLIQAQDQSGFISIDCRSPADLNYTESTTGINYTSDANFINTGPDSAVTPGWPVQFPLFLPTTLPVQPSHSELEGIQSMLQEKNITTSLSPTNHALTTSTGNLKTLLLHGGQESKFESAMRRRIMKFLNISDNDYFMVFTANRTSAYDYENEAVEAMISCSEKRGAKAHSGTCKTKRRCLDQVDSLGLIMITNRMRYLINWLVNSMMKLKHPNAEGVPLVKIYGPKVKFDRGLALAFNVFDWKGEKVEPVLVQKLADRNNISLSYGFFHHVWFADKYAEDKGKVLQTKEGRVQGVTTNKKKDRDELGVTVVTAALSFLANFEDVYKLWTFVARFLDADFVEKERWRYTTLNQKTIEV
ncbi:Aspartyl protease family protein [Glycine max]|nr:Aspartyl protease family protein [Glycine max]